MKILLTTLMLLLPAIACGQKKYEERYPEGQLRLAGYIDEKTGKREGHWTTYYRNGRKMQEGDYKNGEKEGAHYDYDEYGNIYTLYTYRAGILNGPHEQYYLPDSPKGKSRIYVRGTYKDGEAHGSEYIYDEAGKIISRRRRVEGTIVADTVIEHDGIYYKWRKPVPDPVFGGYRYEEVVEFRPYPPKPKVSRARTMKAAPKSQRTIRKPSRPAAGIEQKPRPRLRTNAEGVIEYK